MHFIAWLVYLKGVHLSQVHQPSSMAFICLVGVLSAWLVHLKGGTCLKCTNRVVWLSFAWLVYLLLGWCTYCLVGVLIAWLVHLLLGWCTSCLVGALETSAPPEVTSAQIHRLRPLPDRIPFAVQSDSVRRPIRFCPPSDRIPFAVRSDSVRRPIRFRPPSDRIPFAVQ